MTRADGLSHLDRLARQGAVDGGWITPALPVPRRWLRRAVNFSVGVVASGGIAGLIWAALLAGGVD